MPPPGPTAPTRHPDPSIEHRVLIVDIGKVGGGALAPTTVTIEALATSAATQTKLTLRPSFLIKDMMQH